MATEGGAGRGRARLTIDLDAIAANWRRLAEEAPASEVAGVVKADAYGLGVGEVAPALWRAGCRTFFVAHLDEALELRKLLPDGAIGVLNGLAPGGEQEYVAARLVPVLNHPGEIARGAAFAREQGRRLPAVIQVDTGMCRLGLAPHEVDALDRRALESLDLRHVMSHLVSAEVADDPLNETQRRRFDDLRSRFPGVPSSLANSSGILLGRAFQYELCRPGVALYGVNPTPGRINPMRPVVTLEAPVLQVHEIREPGTVGYGATWRTEAGQRIATVPVGYADGYLRSASSRAIAWIDGVEVRVAGRVSMDLITLDVSALPAGSVRSGTTVTLIGGPDGVDQLAAAGGTIGYEVLTRLGKRFDRAYIRAAS